MTRSMGWTVRAAGRADAGALALAGAATFLDAFAGILDGGDILAHCARAHRAPVYEAWLDGGGLAWLVEDKGAPVGYALAGGVSLTVSDPDPDDVELKRIYLLSRYLGSGAGTALLRHAIEAARAAARRRMLLGVYEGNARARAFYAKAGFVQVGTRQFLVGHRMHDDVVLALDLDVPPGQAIIIEGMPGESR